MLLPIVVEPRPEKSGRALHARHSANPLAEIGSSADFGAGVRRRNALRASHFLFPTAQEKEREEGRNASCLSPNRYEGGAIQ
jgi:hypothetical protein